MTELNKESKKIMLWAIKCAEHVLPYFEDENPKDKRPRKALEAARLWTEGKMKVGEVRRYALSAHAAAREVKKPEAVYAARACGHAAAVAHVLTHAGGVPYYALKAVESAGENKDKERAWEMTGLSRQYWEKLKAIMGKKYERCLHL